VETGHVGDFGNSGDSRVSLRCDKCLPAEGAEERIACVRCVEYRSNCARNACAFASISFHYYGTRWIKREPTPSHNLYRDATIARRNVPRARASVLAKKPSR